MVYLVDDDVDDLEIVQEALAHNSYKGPVKTALNGQIFINDLKESNGFVRPNVIVLDLNMPLKDGFDVLKEIKNNPDLNSIPVVILTASSNKNDETRCRELGCAYFFRKPVSLNEYDPIVMTVKMLLQSEARLD